MSLNKHIKDMSKPTYYNGKFKVIKGDEIFITGKIYEVINGKIANSLLFCALPLEGEPFTSFEDVEKFFKVSRLHRRWSNEHLQIEEVT